MSAFIGVDWGTTNLRAWRLGADGRVEAEMESPHGVRAIAQNDFATMFHRDVHTPLGVELPVLMCGMVGSNLGWREAAYVACPAGLNALARALTPVSDTPSIRIVPGLRCSGLTKAPDVMRGEETQILGWLARDDARRRGRHLLCLPGTHSKWALLQEGEIQRFVTAMTGELFAVLSTHSILKAEPTAFNGDAFAAGVAAAGEGDALSIRMFSARARIVTASANKQDASSYLSGLLIGSEVAAAPRALGVDHAGEIWVIGAPLLRERYVDALTQRGWSVLETDGAQAAIGGLAVLFREGALQ